ncbi:MAG: septal ring lytic transglycosylase RlpA family protein [Lautropia sp.]|nr:septal ring lytic transglycosylase RlpA family protein [Lautropia sp.]
MKPNFAILPILVLSSCLLAGCAGAQGNGNYYLDDGPGSDDASRLERLMREPDPLPVFEPLLDRTNRPYQVMGQHFTPMTSRQPYRMTGVASWYGKRFHGRPTSTGEIYDMYKMTAAHPTLPLPSYARVRNLENGREVVVRVNDRGPFLRGRLIDLSYLAASKLGYLKQGHAKVEVELLNPQFVATGSPSPVQQGVVGAEQVAPSTQPASQEPPAPALAGTLVVEQKRAGPGLAGEGAGPGTTLSVPHPAIASASTGQSQTQAQVVTSQSAGDGVRKDGGWFVQLGIFSELENALRSQRLQQAVSTRDDPPVEIVEQGTRYQVLVGPFDSEQQARSAVAAIEQRTGQRPWVSFRP